MRRRHGLWFALLCALCLGNAATGAERLLLESKSPYNTVLVSEDERGLRILRFERGGARQSVVKPGDPDHLEVPYVRAMLFALVFSERPRRVLVVGLGGGSIPSFLRHRFPDLEIDVVDIDPVVVEVARSHFGFRDDAKLRVEVDDGRRFIERRSGRYDIIFLDAFGPDSVPYALTTREFLRAVRAALTPRGVVISNIWGPSSNPLYDSMVRTYQSVYEEVCTVDLAGAGNKVLVALPWKSLRTRDELIRQSRQLTVQLQLRSDLGDTVERGFQRAGAEAARGRVLIDADSPDRPPAAR